MNRRANTGALAIAQFFVILVAFSMVYMFLQPRYQNIHSMALNQTTNQTAEQGINEVFLVAQHMPLIVVLISVFGLIVLAFFERGRF